MGSRAALILAPLLAVPTASFAHPGHGIEGSGVSLLHWLGEPEHALPLVAFACLCAALWGMAALSRRSS